MKYFWCVGPTVVAQFDTADQAVEELKKESDPVRIVHGEKTLSVKKAAITIMGEDEYESL
jgi:hypothetical protein